MDCRLFTERRQKCHGVYGNRGEDCLHEELTEKRCLSLKLCPRQAKEYYGDVPVVLDAEKADSTSSSSNSFLHNKALCASWAEHFAYQNELDFGSEVANHHRQAQQVVNDDKNLKLECRTIAFQLAQCLRSKRLF